MHAIYCNDFSWDFKVSQYRQTVKTLNYDIYSEKLHKLVQRRAKIRQRKLAHLNLNLKISLIVERKKKFYNLCEGLVGSPEDRFSYNAAQIVLQAQKQCLLSPKH